MEQHSSSSYSEFRSRRPHNKSRKGCLTCKKRRIKCDEKRPNCARCEDSLRTCVYATGSTSQDSPGSSESAAVTSSTSPFVPSPPPSISDPFNNLFSGSAVPSPTNLSDLGSDIVANITDASLYHHYLDHTCKRTPEWHRDPVVVQVGMAKLALDSEPVSHSILAQAAACICWDMICKGNADVETVRQVLNIGLQHHTLALEQMQTMTSSYTAFELQPIVANGFMLVPFAFAFQHLNHWVLSHDCSQPINSVTPRDAIFLMQGIRATLHTLNATKAAESDDSRRSPFKSPYETIFQAQPLNPNSIGPGRLHTMFPVMAATYDQALSSLQRRIESALADYEGEESMAAAFEAYDLLENILSTTFSTAKDATHFSLAPDSLLAQIPGWLQSYILRPEHPTRTEPLLRPLLGFFSRASKTYVQLLLPLIESQPFDLLTNNELTAAQVFALDLYAHWLVLMFLVDQEAWWVGDFPVLALQSLITRYGDEFMYKYPNQEPWWPASMLEVKRRLEYGSTQ